MNRAWLDAIKTSLQWVVSKFTVCAGASRAEIAERAIQPTAAPTSDKLDKF
jgi:hypothetical protein